MGMGPLAKWVDNHILFRIPQEQVRSHNCNMLSGIKKFKCMGIAGKMVVVCGMGERTY